MYNKVSTKVGVESEEELLSTSLPVSKDKKLKTNEFLISLEYIGEKNTKNL